MAMRPGDSTPEPDRATGPTALGNGEGTPAHDHDLPDSHIFQMPVMIPHLSDGTTDVLQRGRGDRRGEQISETTEPMFPRQSAAIHESEPVRDDDATVELQRVPGASPKDQEQTVVMPAVSPAGPSPASVPAAPEAAPPPAGNSLLVLLLLSYASAVTIALVYLLVTRDPETLRQHQLEDLRDPADEEGTVRIYQRGAELPPGHLLALGQSQRFGNVLVEPLRVTRGPVVFDHYSSDTKKQRPATLPVYKLWLRLTNVSREQAIAPFDALLMFKRGLSKSGDLVSNTYLAPRGQAASGPVVFAYPAARDSEWDLRGQSLGRELAPGESLETYIPSDAEGLEQLAAAGELVWRFHLRKGRAPGGRGVTTLVEVLFAADVVQDEVTKSPPESAPELPGIEEQKKGGNGRQGNRPAARHVSPPLPVTATSARSLRECGGCCS